MDPFRSPPIHLGISLTILREAWWESDNSTFFSEMKLGNAFNILRSLMLSCRESPLNPALHSRCDWGKKTSCKVQGWHLEGLWEADGETGTGIHPAPQLSGESSEGVAGPRIWKYAFLVKGCLQYASDSPFPTIKKNTDFYFRFSMPIFRSREETQELWLCHLIIHFFHAQKYLDQNLPWSISCYK